MLTLRQRSTGISTLGGRAAPLRAGRVLKRFRNGTSSSISRKLGKKNFKLSFNAHQGPILKPYRGSPLSPPRPQGALSEAGRAGRMPEVPGDRLAASARRGSLSP